jgi:tRNA (guanine26-N2/guanine27-N2)-dimethyltransferase
MTSRIPTRFVKEGEASIKVPEINLAEGQPLDHAISRAPVFYNPRMKLNRDTAVLALGAYQKRRSKPLSVCEPMCGTGVRGIRLALEVTGVERVVLGDLNPRAIRLAEENAALNGVSHKVRARLMDADLLLSLHRLPRHRFDYVDIDPYGSPAQHLESTLEAISNRGMIALTATDMAPLCGVNPRACLRKYGGLPLRTDYCHEVAVRLLAGALVKNAAKIEIAVEPIFSFAVDHYVRLYARLNLGAQRADDCLGMMGYIQHCSHCLNRRIVYSAGSFADDVCDVCGSRMRIGGPMWLGDLAERSFCDDMMALANETPLSSERRLMQILELVRDESKMPPTFYNIDSLCSRLGIESISGDRLISALKNADFKAVKTHFDERGVKTGATVTELENVLKGMAGRDG